MKKIIAVLIVCILVTAAVAVVIETYKEDDAEKLGEGEDIFVEDEGIIEEFTFSYPTFENNKNYVSVHIDEADFYDIHDGRPTIPVKTATYEFPFGTRILDVIYEHSEPETINLFERIAYGSCSTLTGENSDIYNESDNFPASFVSYKTGGGISDSEHKTFLTIRVNPVIYRGADYEIDFIDHIKFQILYEEPEEPILGNKNEYDLLIISTSEFKNALGPLVAHKEEMGLKTKLVTLAEIEEGKGRDTQEKMKYYIKDQIEQSGIEYVLLVGGMDGQSQKWNLPIRYSHVLMAEGKQETPEPEFISDLYFADIYDSEGNFSSWDSNNNDIFAEGDGTKIIDEMDLYPDVHLGRLPCRNKRQVRIVVDKIIDYESKKADESWFKKMILVSGDHWDDPDHISEGVLIMEEASKIMSDFESVELFATEENTLLVRDINKAINKGAGFAYFCGHGGSTSWGIHYPPEATGWAPSLGKLGLVSFYQSIYMNLLRNRNKLPITVVGGCFNGKFDISVIKNKSPLKTYCWAWKLASVKNGGSIATIANTGLGTHAMSDSDMNGVNDYLETLDGWMELRFFELYSQENVDVLGELHSGAMKDYLHTFLPSEDEMDVKMVQQWELFGDPSLKVGGY